MGVTYNTFLVIFALAQVSFGVMSQADRRSNSLYSRAFASDGIGRLFAAAKTLGQISSIGLMVIGFLSLKWYLVFGIFLGAGLVGSMSYALFTARRSLHGGLFHNFAAGTAGIAVMALTVTLWTQRLLH